jgi:hypothetical protein
VAIGLAALDDTEVEAANTQHPMLCKLDLNSHNYSQTIWWHKHVSLNTAHLA